MELINIIYDGLKISIALLGVVIILSYLLSRLRLKRKKTDNPYKSNLSVANTPTIISEPILKNNFYYSEALRYNRANEFNISNVTLRYLKSGDEIFKESEKYFNHKRNNDKRTRYTIINEEMRKKSNKSTINFFTGLNR